MQTLVVVTQEGDWPLELEGARLITARQYLMEPEFAALRHAKVFVSVLGGQTERELTMKALEKSRGFLQAKINASLHMRHTPQLQFVYDETLDNALRIERALKREAEVLGEEPHEIPVPGAEPEAGGGEDAAADAAGGGSETPGAGEDEG